MNRHHRRAAEARQRQEDARLKRFASSSAGAAIVAIHESLTTPDKEDWNILVDGADLYLTAAREHDGRAQAMFVQTTVSGFKAGGSKGSIETLPAGKLGCITIVLPTDAKEWWCRRAHVADRRGPKRGGFSLMSIDGSVPTCDAVKAWKDNALRRAQVAGEA